MSQIFSVLLHLMFIASPRLKSITGVHSVNASGCLTMALPPDSPQRHISPRSYIQISFPHLSQSLLHSCFYASKSIRTHLVFQPSQHPLFFLHRLHLFFNSFQIFIRFSYKYVKNMLVFLAFSLLVFLCLLEYL